MALRALELKKQIDDQRKALGKVEDRIAKFSTRESDLERKIAEAVSDEDRSAVEAEVAQFNADKTEADNEAQTIRDAIEQMEHELEALEAEEPSRNENIEERGLNIMENIELRDSVDYGKAFVNYIITGKDEQIRSMLTDNVSGTVPVPTMLDTEIRNAWEDCQIMKLVKKTSYKGNVKVGFELSATGANVHVEGAEAPDEETLVWGAVELKAESIKKWITVSDEAIDGTTIDTLREIYKEIAQRIVEKAEEIAIGKITTAPATSSATACAVPKFTATTIAEDTIVKAVSQLSGKARNLHIAMNRQTYADFVSVALKAKYAVDVFDGLKDRVVFTDALPAFSAAASTKAYMIIGDFGYGFQANFPNGHEMTIKVDDLSLSEKDLVKIVGREYVGMGVVAPKAFVNVVK